MFDGKTYEPTPNTAKDAGLAAAQQCADSNTPVCAATALYAPARAPRAPATPDYTSGTCAALAAETRTFLPTKEAAAHLGRRAQTLRYWAMAGGKGPISPVRVGGRLAWAVSDIKRLLGAPA